MFSRVRIAIRFFFVGLAVGVLLAPRSGEETRRLLREKADSLLNDVLDAASLGTGASSPPPKPAAAPRRDRYRRGRCRPEAVDPRKRWSNAGDVVDSRHRSGRLTPRPPDRPPTDALAAAPAAAPAWRASTGRPDAVARSGAHGRRAARGAWHRRPGDPRGVPRRPASRLRGGRASPTATTPCPSDRGRRSASRTSSRG